MSVAVVPVKGLSDAKSRLLPELPRDGLAELTLAMLGDIVEALLGAPSVEEAWVVTPDGDVADHARSLGARVLFRREPGLNASIDAAALAAAGPRRAACLTVLGDVAGAESREIEELHRALEELGRPGAVLAPSADGGSSALLRAPFDCLPSRFGPASAKQHREAASEAGVPLRELALPSLALDLDRPEDLTRFRQSRGGGRRTRAVLEALAGAPESP